MTKTTWDDIIENGAYSQELDWFAVDNKGYIGVFTATQNAPIPNKIKMSFENYIEIREVIKLLPNITSSVLVTLADGDFSDYISYSQKGIFSFDFQDVHRTIKKKQYDLIARPVKPLSTKDKNIPSNILSNMIELNCNFSDGDLNIEKIL